MQKEKRFSCSLKTARQGVSQPPKMRAPKLVQLTGVGRVIIVGAGVVAASAVAIGAVGVNETHNVNTCRGIEVTGNSIHVFLSLVTVYALLYLLVTGVLLLVFAGGSKQLFHTRASHRAGNATLRLATYNMYTLMSVFFLSSWFSTSAVAGFQCRNPYATWLFALSCGNILLLIALIMIGGIEVVGGQIGRELQRGDESGEK